MFDVFHYYSVVLAEIENHETRENRHDHFRLDFDDVFGQSVDPGAVSPRHVDGILGVVQLVLLSK